MADSDSISIWLGEVKRGDDEAARRLWERYFPYLVRLAQKKLAGVPRRMEDEEDVALSAFDSFCRAADMDRFPHLSDRQGLWRLLCRITHRKAVDLIRRTQTAMGDANVLGESRFADSSSVRQPVAPVAEADAAGDFAAMVAEEVRRLLHMLPDEELRRIAVEKMEGHTNPEIAERLGCAERTVERRLKYIRVIWKREVSSRT
ncbi:MAG: ECF-type sigma factor [Planctomycetota bacterium]|jgi:DNA-directed RNA polymerase specialized sigma24 family protein